MLLCTIKKNIFITTDIRGCKRGGCSDPTGVRLRLLKSRKNSQRSQHVFDSSEQGAGSHDFKSTRHGGSGHGGGGGKGSGGNGGGGNNGGGGGGGGR